MPSFGNLSKKTVNSLSASYFAGFDPMDTTQTLSGTTVTWPASAMNTYVWSNSANYNIDKISTVYTTVNSNSANWSYQGTDVKALSSDWQSTYTYFSSQSANNASVYTTVNSNSAVNWNAHPPAVSLTYNASLTPNTADGLFRKVTMTGGATLNAPTNPSDGMVWKGRFLASGADRALTLNVAIKIPTEFTATIDNPVTITSGKTWKVQLEYDSDLVAWCLTGWTGGY